MLFPALRTGGSALIEARFDPDRALELIETSGVTLLFGVTSMYLELALAQSPRWAQADLSALAAAAPAAAGGAAPPPGTGIT